jgi:CHAT domain-containing protein/uncharacterized protein HemY
MVSRFYSLTFIFAVCLLNIVLPPDLPFVTSQAQVIQNRKIEAEKLRTQGNQLYTAHQYLKALEYFEQALQIYREIQDVKGEGITLGSMGFAYSHIGEYQKALDYAQKSLSIARQIGNPYGEQYGLNNLGSTYVRIGQYYKAINHFQEALAIAKKVNNLQGQSMTLTYLGHTYTLLGQYQKAIDNYQQSLEIAKQIRNYLGQGTLLGNLGRAYSSLGQYEKAIEYHQQALEISQKFSASYAGVEFHNLGNTYHRLGQYQKALEYFQQSLSIAKQFADRQGEGSALNNLGETYASLGQTQKAIEHLQASLLISNQIDDREAASDSFNNLGNLFAKLNKVELAIFFYKKSVNTRESLRKNISGLTKEEQKSYVETFSGTYRTLADLLLKQERVMEALQILDLLKVQEIDDYLKNINGSNRILQRVRFLQPEQAISSQLLTISLEQIPELNRQLSNQIQQLPKSEINKAPDYLQNLPKGTAILYPLMLEDRLEIVLFASNNSFVHRTINIKKNEIENLVSAFRKNLTKPSLDARDSSKKLYDVLIKPIEDDLKQIKANTILYAPDGQLRYIPLAALYDGKQWLIERYRINNLIAYILFDQNSKTQSNPTIFAGAYGNSNQKLVSGFNQLPATLPEVESIKTTFANTTAITEQNFTADASKSKAVGNAIVHLATHASFQSGSPLDSYVLFGDGSKATISDISEWNLKDVNLFVLSACQTGLGTSANGAEILGFGYQVQRAGAKASIASLWEVSDGGTQLLMQAFYSQIKQGNISTSEALRQAQIAMIYSDKKGEGSDRATIKIVGTLPNNPEGKLSHPYYWSAFVLIGNGL